MTKRNSQPRLFTKTGNMYQKKESISRLNAQGVGPLSIAVRLGVSARLVLEILESGKEDKSYEPQSRQLGNQYL